MSDKVYHWLDDSGAWQLARPVVVTGERIRRQMILQSSLAHVTCLMVQHLYSSRLEWVPESKLLPYPSAKIEEPTK